MAVKWGRSRGKVAGSKDAQDTAIFLWLKRGYFEVNSQLVEHRATISHTNFWKKVRTMLPPEKK